MARLLSISEDGKQFRFYSTIADDWLTDWLSRDEALRFIRDSKQAELAKEMELEEAAFPNGWFDMDKKCVRNDNHEAKMEKMREQLDNLRKLNSV